MLLLLFDNAVNVNLELFGSGHMSHILGNKGPHNVEIWMVVSVGFFNSYGKIGPPKCTVSMAVIVSLTPTLTHL